MAENRTAPSRRALLLQHLVKTHGAIAEEAKLIVRQRQLITDLERDGGDTREDSSDRHSDSGPVVACVRSGGRCRLIGLLGAAIAAETLPQFRTAFRRGLGKQGYMVGVNIEIVEHQAGNRYDLLPEMAADLERRRVSVIFAERGIAPALAAKSATATIPIVFENGADPVEFDLVASLPGLHIHG